jgi:small-conductance mechanosensitive channel
MNRLTYCSLAILAGTLASPVAQAQQPLGDYARTVRKDKEKEPKTSAKKYDNDNLPVNDKLSIVGNPPPDEPAAGAAPAARADANAAAKPADSAADKQKVNDEWKTKIATQKDQISLMSRELDVAQREYRLRAAAMYADAGNRLRNQAGWDKEDAQYKQQIAQKQKALDDAKQKLNAMQEEARHAGVPASARQ